MHFAQPQDTPQQQLPTTPSSSPRGILRTSNNYTSCQDGQSDPKVMNNKAAVPTVTVLEDNEPSDTDNNVDPGWVVTSQLITQLLLILVIGAAFEETYCYIKSCCSIVSIELIFNAYSQAKWHWYKT